MIQKVQETKNMEMTQETRPIEKQCVFILLHYDQMILLKFGEMLFA